MNRRALFKGLLALPVVAALAPLLPKEVTTAAPESWKVGYATREALLSTAEINDAINGAIFYDFSPVLYVRHNSEWKMERLIGVELVS